MRARFGECQLDTDARQFTRNGRQIVLSPKAFETLRLLVDERPRALSKSEILDRVWRGVSVSDASLARVINEIRRGVGDRARPGTTIRTVHAFGYAFAADVQEEDANIRSPAPEPVRCWLTCGRREFALTPGEHVVGREPGLAIRLDSPKVSRRHARITVRDDQVTIEDLGSKNGTFAQGVQVDSVVAIRPGTIVRIGGFRLTLHQSADLGPTESEVSSHS